MMDGLPAEADLLILAHVRRVVVGDGATTQQTSCVRHRGP